MNDTVVTIQGNVASDVTSRVTSAGHAVANFRLASTPRRPGRSSGEWVDGPTAFYSVSCWRGLADNVAESLARGMPVIVHGRLTQRAFQRQVNGETVRSLSVDIDAFTVGPDLTFGVAEFQRGKHPGVRRAEERALRDAAMAAHPSSGADKPVAATAPASQVA